MYTNDCHSSYEDRHIIKYADDSVIVSLLQEQDRGHGPVVEDFVTWCSNFHLQLNVEKNKDMLIDFGRSTLSPGLMNIDEVDIELTDNHKYLGIIIDDNHKYLGIIIDDKLSFEANVSVVCKKIQQRLFF